MKLLKYFFEFIFIYILFLIFKIIGYKNSSNLGEKIGKFFWSIYKIKKKIINNLKDSNIGVNDLERETIIKKNVGKLRKNSGRISVSKKFKNNSFEQYIEIEVKEYLEEIKKDNRKVVFCSGHFNNFELMAMQLKLGLNIAAIYRPLNNVFLNRIMEKIRLNDICKKQIKGKSGTRELLQLFKDGYSIALMIDQG